MLSIVGVDEIVENYLAISRNYGADATADESAAAAAYSAFLKTQPIFEGTETVEDFGNAPLFLPVLECTARLPSYNDLFYKHDASLSEKRAPAKHDRWTPDACSRTFGNFSEDFPDIAGIFSLYVKAVVLDCLDPYGSASASDAIGVVSINGKNDFSEWDIMEMFVHELTHNLLFVDHIIAPHATEEAQTDPPKVLSPIREERRDIYLAFHALVVAFELLKFRERSGTLETTVRVHPASGTLIDSCLRTCAEMAERAECFEPRGAMILKAVKSGIEALSARLPR